MNRDTDFRTENVSAVTLLTLPTELREIVWRIIFDDIIIDSEVKWFSRPKTKFDGLPLTCVKIRHEIINWFPRIILPHRRVDIFISHPNAYVSRNFSLLALEVPFHKPTTFFQEAARALKDLSGTLQDLRLYFTGKDAFGVSTWLHGCGLREPSVRSIARKLTIDGQRHEDRQSLFGALYYLQNLHSMTIENANYPILQTMVIKSKRCLRNLRLLQDPRSTLHCNHAVRGEMRRMIFPPVSDLAPVETLHITTNSCLTALQVASKIALTLKYLTWVVPDPSRQSGRSVSDWLRDTSLLLRNLGNGKDNVLQTLRVCIESATYEANNSFGELIGGFSMYLPRLKKLRILELHLHSKSNWFGGEIIDALPSSVARLYMSDRSIPPKVLTSKLLQEYGGQSPSPSPPTYCDHHYQLSSSPFQNLTFLPISYNHHQNGIVGEDATRSDFISLHSGRLGFVGYEFEQSHETSISLLTLNGRLLDRERNLHLCLYNGGCFIPSRQSDKTLNNELAKDFETIEGDEGLAGVEQDWQFSQRSPHAWYFGAENEAQKVFDGEAVARTERLDPSKSIEEVAYEEHEHWMTEG